MHGQPQSHSQSGGRGHAHTQAREGARTGADDDGGEVGVGQGGVVKQLLNGGNELLVVRTRIADNAVDAFPRGGVDDARDEVSRGSVECENLH